MAVFMGIVHTLTPLSNGRVLVCRKPGVETQIEYVAVTRARIFRSRFRLQLADGKRHRFRAAPNGVGLESIGMSGRGRYYWGITDTFGSSDPSGILGFLAFLIWLPYGVVMSPLILRESHQRRRNAKIITAVLTTA